MSTSSKRIKWPPPPPSPKILHFPRRRRTRRKPTSGRNNPPLLLPRKYRGRLDALFDQENEQPPPRRERVDGGGTEEEKWRFQAEILRAECNLLRMERELALKKLEKNRVKMETTLKSAVQTLVSGREKIFEGKNATAVLEEEIEDLEDKLEALQNSPTSVKDCKSNCSNFDKKACLLQRRLDKLGGDNHLEMDLVRKKMEGVLDRVEQEYNSMASISCTSNNSSVASSASTSKRIDFPQFSCSSTTRHLMNQDTVPQEINKCSGRCKVIVRRIVEQVRAESEQWSQMQEMLVLVRAEMEELHKSRDYWENRAHDSNDEIQTLRLAVDEWREMAADYENKANGLQLEVTLLKEEMHKSKVEIPLAAQLVKERIENEETTSKDLPPLSLGKQLAQEKRMLLRRLRENLNSTAKHTNSSSTENGGPKRSPLRDVNGNSSRHNLKAASDLLLTTSKIRESFRKPSQFAC